jgi:hypothetical protein
MRKVQTLQKAPFPLPDAVTKVVPSPTDGWDALSPLALMDPRRAPILINWVPRPGWVELRSGYFIWATTGPTYLTGNPVESLMIYRALGSEKMFAASGGVIYDVSTQSVATPVVTGLIGNRWQYVDFTPSLGTTVIQIVNGVDSLHMYNGTTWTTPAITGLPGGVGSAAIRNIAVQKRRVWFVLNNGAGQGTTVAAFMPTDAITGPIAGSLDLGALWNKGGFLQAIANWTIDGGAGPNDYICFISNKGQISIYQGTDPLSASNFALVGTFDLPPPIGDRCVTRVGSDVGVITLQGVLPLSSSLPFDPSADRSVAITSRIQNAMSQSANSFFANFGWQLISYPAETLLFLNIPQATNSQQFQYVMNTLTGAWCQFTGWNANCFDIFNNVLYWGDNLGNVNQGYVGNSDLFSTINADMQCAFNYFDDPGRVKRMTMVQPLLTTTGTITPLLGVDTDFSTSTVSAPVTTPSLSASQWDNALWDVSLWPAGNINLIAWLSVDALGHAMALRLKINFSGGLSTANGVFDFGVFDSAKFDFGLSSTDPILQVNSFNTVLELGGFV